MPPTTSVSLRAKLAPRSFLTALGVVDASDLARLDAEIAIARQWLATLESARALVALEQQAATVTRIDEPVAPADAATARRAIAIGLRAQGYTIQEIASRLNATRSTTARDVRGVRRRRGVRPEEREQPAVGEMSRDVSDLAALLEKP